MNCDSCEQPARHRYIGRLDEYFLCDFHWEEFLETMGPQFNDYRYREIDNEQGN
jgi:hypothetical protein